MPWVETTDAMVRLVDQAMLSIGRCQPGDLLVIVAGFPPAAEGSVNLIRVHRLGEATLADSAAGLGTPPAAGCRRDRRQAH